VNASPAPVRRAWAALPVALAWLTVLALVERVRTWVRRRRGVRPRLIWGPIPVISLKYWSEAMRRAGYPSLTCVAKIYAINVREDFDVFRDEFGRGSGLSGVFRDYRFFAWSLRRGDVFIRFFDGGFLQWTHLRWMEGALMRLAGKRVIVSPYGSDIAVAGHLGNLEEPLFADYPALRDEAETIKRRVDYSLKWADLVIRNWQFGYLPRSDVVWLSQLAIDVTYWTGDGDLRGSATGATSEVTVLHAPNHRHVKGSVHLERAIEALREEGLPVRLELLEQRPNREIRRAMAECDIVADQFLAGYAMFAIEGMAMGKPVLANLDSIPDELRDTEAMRACPIVDTDPARLRDDLRALVLDEARRRELGRAGREFVLRHHSYEAVAEVWEAIFAHLWRGAPLPEYLQPGPD
jgi:glycosyltransferase involved in cell wall biosynthesis